MVEIRNSEDLETWLETGPEGASVLIGTRLALRFLPKFGNETPTLLLQKNWRTIALNCYSVFFLIRSRLPLTHIQNANVGAFSSKKLHNYHKSLRSTELPFREPVLAIGLVSAIIPIISADDLSKTIADFSEIVDLVISPESIELYTAITLDCTALEAGVDLWSQPLWLNDIPEWAVRGWETLATELTKRAPYWKTLVQWYEDRVRGDDWAASQGRPAVPELEIARASLPDSYWKKGGKAVNLAIAELEAFFWEDKPLQDPMLRELVERLGVMTEEPDDRAIEPEIVVEAPSDAILLPPIESIPEQSPRAFQFAAPSGGPIDLAPSLPDDILNDAPDRREDYAELRHKAQELFAEGINRLGRLGTPIDRFLALGDDLGTIRAKLLWSRINTLRNALHGHRSAVENALHGGERDERLLEGVVADKATDLVETANVFVGGDANLMELDARRSGPKELVEAQEQVAIIAPLLTLAGNDRVMTAALSGEIIQEQAANVLAADDTLAGRQAAELGAKTERNFISVLLGIGRRELLDGGKDVKSGVYRAVGGKLLDATVTYGPGIASMALPFIAEHAEALIRYVQLAFNNVDIEQIIRIIASLF